MVIFNYDRCFDGTKYYFSLSPEGEEAEIDILINNLKI